MVHEQLTSSTAASAATAHPWRCAAPSSAPSAFYHDSLDIHDPHQRMTPPTLVAKMRPSPPWPTSTRSASPSLSAHDLSYSANFLRMMFSVRPREIRDQSVLEKAVDRILMLHADHEQNASTRLSASPVPRAPTRSPASPRHRRRCGAPATAAQRGRDQHADEIGGKQNIPGFLSRVEGQSRTTPA